MKRKMVWVGLPWMTGLFLAVACSAPMTVCLLLAAWMLLGAFCLLRLLPWKQALCVGLSLLFAIGATLLYTRCVYQPVMTHDGSASTFSGTVTSAVVYDNDRAAYQVKGCFSDGTSAKILVYTDDLGAQYGDTLAIAGTFSAPEDTYLFSGTSYYRAKGIFLEAESDAYVTCTHTNHGKLIRLLQTYRARISTRICVLAGTDAGGMVSAMLLGTKDTVSEETENVLTQNGVRHVLSVSGLHLVLLLSLWIWLAARLHLHRWISFSGSVLFTILYALLVGVPISILRAGLMFLLVQGAPLCFRKADTFQSLCIAGIVLTVSNPYLILDASFLLSMSGTFGIAVFAPWMTRHINIAPLRKIAALICVSICTFPVTLLYFQEASILSPLANLLLVPIASLMLLLSLGIFLTGGVGWIAKPICVVLHLLYDLLMLLAHGLQRLVPWTFSTDWNLLPFLAGILVLFVLSVFWYRQKPRAVSFSLVLSFFLLLIGQTIYRYGEKNCFLVTVLGNSTQAVVIVSYQGKTDVIDLTGHHANAEYVAAYLQEYGIYKLDSLCLTKRAAQMRVTYTDALSDITVTEAVVPSDSFLFEQAKILSATPQKADTFVLQDTAYTITYANGTLQITYGTLQFCVGTVLEEQTDTTWDAIICTTWHSTEANVPEELYQKDAPVQLRVQPSGTWTIEPL